MTSISKAKSIPKMSVRSPRTKDANTKDATKDGNTKEGATEATKDGDPKPSPSGVLQSNRSKRRKKGKPPAKVAGSETRLKTKHEAESKRNRTKEVSKNEKLTEKQQVTLKKKAVTPHKPPPVADNEIVEGINSYKVTLHIKSGKVSDLYKVKDVEQETSEYLMKIACVGKGRLKFEAGILQKANRLPGEKKFADYIEFGTCTKLKVDYIITSLVGPCLDEVRIRYLKVPYTQDCALNIAKQTFKALRDLHRLGSLNRNVRPAAFNVGVGSRVENIYLMDIRIARPYLDVNKKPKPLRDKVKFLGTPRFASRTSLKSLDQTRKDDVESWVYMVFSLLSEDSLPWKKMDNDKILAKKEQLFKHELDGHIFPGVPESLKGLIDHVEQSKFESDADYDGIVNILKLACTQLNIPGTAADWKGKLPEAAEKNITIEYSVDNKLMGELDDIVEKDKTEKKEQKKGKAQRKKMNSGDVIRSDASAWKVVVLLGSGGFGDVYKVHRENGDKTKMYALKTESDSGDKRMLRLKVEVTVMMKCWADKSKKFGHFVEFIDRGRCEALKCKFVVMGLVSASIEDIRRKHLLSQFSKNSTLNIALQTVQSVWDLHSLGYLHRDIKPANFAVGLGENEKIVYMLDFGIAKTFLDANGQHKTPRKKVKFLGTLKYAARACMKCVEQGRKDDLECWLYMVFDLMDENYGMPWRRTTVLKDILKEKEAFFAGEFPEVYNRMPKTFNILVTYVDKLEYSSMPDYEYILTFIKTVAKDNNINIDKKLDWIGKIKAKVKDSDSEKTEEEKQTGDSGSG